MSRRAFQNSLDTMAQFSICYTLQLSNDTCLMGDPMNLSNTACIASRPSHHGVRLRNLESGRLDSDVDTTIEKQALIVS